MGIASFLQAGECLEAICVVRRAGSDVLGDAFEVRNHRQSKTSGHVLHVTSQEFARCIHPGPAQFVEHPPRGFISDEPQLALEKQGRDATRIRRHQVRHPKPERQRRLRVIKGGPDVSEIWCRHATHTATAVVSPWC